MRQKGRGIGERRMKTRGLMFTIQNAITQEDIKILQGDKKRSLNDLSLIDLVQLNKDSVVRNILESDEWRPFIKSSMIIELVNHATEKGSLNFIQYLYNKGGIINSQAGFTDRIDVIEWIFEHISNNELKRNIMENAMNSSVESGNINTLNFLLENGAEISDTEKFEWYIGRGGHISVLRWLLEHEFTVDFQQILEFTVQYEHLNTTRWILEHIQNLNVNSEIKYTTIRNGNIEMLKLLIEKGGAVLNPSDISNTSDFKMVQWLHKPPHNFPIIYDTMTRMAQRCTPKNIEWLLRKGGRVYPEMIVEASSTGNIELLEWLYENFPELYRNNNDVEQGALEAITNVRTLNWFYERFPEVVINVIRNNTDSIVSHAPRGKKDLFEWLIEHSFRDLIPDMALEVSIEYGWYDLTEYLFDIGLRLDDEELELALSNAEINTYFRILRLVSQKI